MGFRGSRNSSPDVLEITPEKRSALSEAQSGGKYFLP